MKKIEFLNKEYKNEPEVYTTSKSIEVHFYPYNAESIRDWGWGCAWRCIQSLINTQFTFFKTDLFLSFEDMFYYFGDKDRLLSLFCELYSINSDDEKYKILMKNEFAPHETESGWAEPWIGHLCLHYFGMQSEIILLNGLPKSHANFKEIFNKTKIYDFKSFLDVLKEKMKLPVMIDDGDYAMLVIDFYENETKDGWHFCITDPHVMENIKEKGSYYIIHTNKEGKQISNTVSENQKKYILPYRTYKAIDFEEKSWIIMIPVL